MTIEQEFRAYQRRLLENPNTVNFYLVLPDCQRPEKLVQYHMAGADSFGAVFDIRKNFCSYIPKIEFN